MKLDFLSVYFCGKGEYIEVDTSMEVVNRDELVPDKSITLEDLLLKIVEEEVLSKEELLSSITALLK